jgi:hypothetical protein
MAGRCSELSLASDIEHSHSTFSSNHLNFEANTLFSKLHPDCTTSMSATLPAPSSLLALPAELRIHLYNAIIVVTAFNPTINGESRTKPPPIMSKRPLVSLELTYYCGLILSCKQVKAEFEHEWAPTFNEFLQALVGDNDATLDIAWIWEEFRKSRKCEAICSIWWRCCPITQIWSQW